MKNKRRNLATAGLATASGLAVLISGSTSVGAEDGDAAVVASREAAAAKPQPAGYTNPPAVVADGPANDAGPGRALSYMKDLYYLSAKQTTGGYIEVSARDNPAQDKPGTATTTLRVYGNAAAFRTGVGDLGLNSKFTCTGAGISGLTIGSGGVSVSGGPTSSTLTWPSLRNDSAVIRQYYTEGGHFRCKASNASFAKFTRRGTASANYKSTDTRAEDEYSFAW